MTDQNGDGARERMRGAGPRPPAHPPAGGDRRVPAGIGGAAPAKPGPRALAAPPAARKLPPTRKPASIPKPGLMKRVQARAGGARLRLLPLTIFVAVLMLGFRVGDLWRIAAREPALPEFPVSVAQTAPAADAKAAGDAASRQPPVSGPAAAESGAAGRTAPGPLDPLGPIDNKELLQHYAERRSELDKRTKDLEQREALLAAAEKRIEQKLTELEKVRGEIQKLLRTGDQRQSEQLDSLVKIYETMKPKEAARIFEEMDMPVLLDVIGRMKETKTAPILAAMDPVKATAVTSALVERRALPAVPQ